jgi:hypothetical protein
MPLNCANTRYSADQALKAPRLLSNHQARHENQSLVGGLIAVGFDPTGKFLLTVSHGGRGVFAVATWERVARDSSSAYPEDGHVIGIGPQTKCLYPVIENYEAPQFRFTSPEPIAWNMNPELSQSRIDIFI